MADFDKIYRLITQNYQTQEQSPIEIDLPVQVPLWVSYAKEYISAAGVIDSEMRHSFLPRLQLTGQAVELSLKACLASSNKEPPRHHNLVNITRLAINNGFEFTKLEMAATIHLSHFYFMDLSTGTNYKTRYPTKTTEQLGGAVPYHKTFLELVHSLSSQAEDRIPMINQGH